MTSGVPKKSRTWGQAPGTLMGSPGLQNCPGGLNPFDARGRSRFCRHPGRLGRRGGAGPASLAGVPMSDVTRILCAIEQGDPHAAGQLLPLVYDALRQLAAEKLAREKPGQTLQATALAHEAYVRLVDGDRAPHWDGRRHF